MTATAKAWVVITCDHLVLVITTGNDHFLVIICDHHPLGVITNDHKIRSVQKVDHFPHGMNLPGRNTADAVETARKPRNSIEAPYPLPKPETRVLRPQHRPATAFTHLLEKT
jgi:hypothetical protein